MTTEIRLRHEVRDYTLFSGTIPIDGSLNVLYNVPGYDAGQRVTVTGDGASTIEELVQGITPGVQEAQFVTTNTAATATILYTNIATLTLDTVGSHNELKMNVLVSSQDATNGSMFDVAFSAVQVDDFGNDPIIDATTSILKGSANVDFFYVIDQNTPTTIISLYAGITGANTELSGFVTSETVPEVLEFASQSGFETISGEVAFGVNSPGCTGELKIIASSVVPAGTLTANGAAVSRSTYSRLFARIGTTWGVGNGTTTFNIPDLVAAAPVGYGTSTGYTQNETIALGTKYNDQTQEHIHSIQYYYGASGTPGRPSSGESTAVSVADPYNKTSVPVVSGANGTPRTGSVTRGKVVGVHYVVVV